MPTPFGHALGGVAVGCLVAAAARRGRRHQADDDRSAGNPRSWGQWRGLGALALVGVVADIDFVFGVHRGLTHSMGATLVAGVVAAAVVRRGRVVTALVVAAAYASHVVLDWLGADPGTPSGVMALWPLTREFYLSDPQVFLRVCREYWLVECWWHNLAAVGRELLVLVPVVAIVVWSTGLTPTLRCHRRPRARNVG